MATRQKKILQNINNYIQYRKRWLIRRLAFFKFSRGWSWLKPYFIIVNWCFSLNLRTAYHRNSIIESSNISFELLKEDEEKLQKIGGASYRELVKGNLNRSYELLEEVINKSVFKEAKEEVLKTFLALAYYIKGEDFDLKKFRKNNFANAKSVDKIMVSGMLYSGSGALYDFFNEFSSITAIRPELRLIEDSKGSLSAIQRELNKINDSGLKDELTRMFYFNLLGFVSPQNDGEDRGPKNTRKLVKNFVNIGLYVYAINYFIYEIVRHSKNNSLTLANYEIITSIFVDLLFNSVLYGYNDEKVLLNNIIHLQNISYFPLVYNCDIFCVIRDPRSQYVSIIEESGKKRFENVHEFIDIYKTRIYEFNKSISFLSQEKAKRIFTVRFEDFVVSEEYRNLLAENIGLDLNYRIKYSNFKPWESIENVDNYRYFNDQRAIKIIEKKLPKYIYEVPTK